MSFFGSYLFFSNSLTFFQFNSFQFNSPKNFFVDTDMDRTYKNICAYFKIFLKYYSGKIVQKICPLRGHILIAHFARSSLRSQDWARLGRAIRSSRCALQNFWTSRFALRSFWTSRFALGLVLSAYISVYFL